MGKPRLVGRSIAVLVHSRQVLLVESKVSPGFWVPPGGTMEPRERAADTAVREVREETGVVVSAGRLIAFREVWWEGHDSLELFFAADLLSAPEHTGRGGEEGRKWRWAELGALKDVPHFPRELEALCRLAASPRAPVKYLGPLDLRTKKR